MSQKRAPRNLREMARQDPDIKRMLDAVKRGPPTLLKRLQNARIAFGGATVARHDNGVYYRELLADEWDALCDELKAIEMALRSGAAPQGET